MEELIDEAGESGRDNGATPLTWAATTAGEAMVGGEMRNGPSRCRPREGGRWEVGCGMSFGVVV